jgi:hypothetical protein
MGERRRDREREDPPVAHPHGVEAGLRVRGQGRDDPIWARRGKSGPSLRAVSICRRVVHFLYLLKGDEEKWHAARLVRPHPVHHSWYRSLSWLSED